MSVDNKKMANLILYLAGHPNVSGLGLTKLYKLVFFSDVTHLRSHGSSITGSEYIKYPFGPVPSRGEKVLKQLAKNQKVEVRSTSLNETRDIRRVDVRRLAEEMMHKLDPELMMYGTEEDPKGL